MYEY